MILASQLRPGMAIRYEGEDYKVLLADYHPGQGKMGGVTHARLGNLRTGTQWEHSFRADLKLDDLAVEKRSMEFLYSDEDYCYFMNQDTFEQVMLPCPGLQNELKFLMPGMLVPVEFVEDEAKCLSMPPFVELRVSDTAAPVHQQQDGAWKDASLENGMTMLVPLFIKNDEVIRVDTATGKYMERAKGAGK
jgi:elongation factor P